MYKLKSVQDDAGDLYEGEDTYLRGIKHEKTDLYKKIFLIYQEENLKKMGVVDTKLVNCVIPKIERKYGFFFQHKKIEPISYPHEWSSLMLRDAALFHINLLLNLKTINLFLKDWHPWNIVFNYSTPVFVDFLSLIPYDKIKEQEYLHRQSKFSIANYICSPPFLQIYIMYIINYLPYFYYPLKIMAQKRYSVAHRRILETTINNSKSKIKNYEIYIPFSISYFLASIKKIANLCFLVKKDENRFFFSLRKEILNLPLDNKPSDYLNYYDNKGENFDYISKDRWSEKNKAIYDILVSYRPNSVLDLGCNTGWYSILASKLGYKVIAVDIDDECINRLYIRAKDEKLDILPIVLDLAREIQDEYCSKHFVSNDLILPISIRIKSEFVMMLGLIHHLTLGLGLPLEIIIDYLCKLSQHYLIIEYVSLDDLCILNNKSYFPKYNKSPHDDNILNYSLNNIIDHCKKCFKTVEIFASSPDTRKLIFCKK